MFIFSVLAIYMNRKSDNAVYEIGKIYMSGMNEQMSSHFESVIELRFSQVDGIVSAVSPEFGDKEKLYEELAYRTRIRDFDYLALCSEEGDSVGEDVIAEFGAALKNDQEYSATLDVNGVKQQIYGRALPHSEWYLVSVMPYSILDSIMNTRSSQRMIMTILSCVAILILLSLIFLRYFDIINAHVRESERARKEAMEANRAKSEFLANMSHDIRTPSLFRLSL